MSKQYLYVWPSGLYLVNSSDDLHKYHKGLRLVGEANQIINNNMEYNAKLEQALKSNGDLRAQIDDLQMSVSQLETQLRNRTYS